MQIEIEEFEAMMNRILAAQQPFFSDMLARMAEYERDRVKTTEVLNRIQTTLAVMADQNLQARLHELHVKFEELQALKHQWEGSIKFMNWAPKIVMWLAILVAFVVAYQTGAIHVQPISVH